MYTHNIMHTLYYSNDLFIVSDSVLIGVRLMHYAASCVRLLFDVTLSPVSKDFLCITNKKFGSLGAYL